MTLGNLIIIVLFVHIHDHMLKIKDSQLPQHIIIELNKKNLSFKANTKHVIIWYDHIKET